MAENFQILLSRFTLYFCRLLSFAVLLRKFNNVPQSWHYRFLPHNGFRHFRDISNAHKILNSLFYFIVTARQCSSRGGELTIHVREDNRVDITGQAVLVLQGSLYV